MTDAGRNRRMPARVCGNGVWRCLFYSHARDQPFEERDENDSVAAQTVGDHVDDPLRWAADVTLPVLQSQHNQHRHLAV